MSVTRIVWSREAARAFVTPAVYATLVIFAAASAGCFVAALQFGEGGFWSLPALWTLSVGLTLPVLAAMATMRLFAGERSAGTLTSLLTVPAPEREILMGKYLAALGTVLLGLAGAIVPWLLLRRALPYGMPPITTLTGPLLVLCLQALSLTALGTLASVLARQSWSAAAGTMLTVMAAALIWGACARFFPEVRGRAPLFPFLIELLDAASGRIALSSLVMHGSLTWGLLFASKRLLEARTWH
ncbi:MAG: ABC transporter permease [Kiritimatiellae bacterium]|nr:ABC transporter permease [Kiritimatiellia bacterium]